MEATDKQKDEGQEEKISEQFTGTISFWPSFSIPTPHFSDTKSFYRPYRHFFPVYFHL
jgi:hypothetical protein